MAQLPNPHNYQELAAVTSKIEERKLSPVVATPFNYHVGFDANTKRVL